MPTIADVLLDVANLKANRDEQYNRLVDALAGGQEELDPVEVDAVVVAARKTMVQFVNDVDVKVARLKADALLATHEDVFEAKSNAERELTEITDAADASVKQLREKHTAELRAAIAARDTVVAEAAAKLEAAERSMGDIEEARNYLLATADDAKRGRVGMLRYDRDRKVSEIEQFRLGIAESNRILLVNPLVPDRDETTHPLGTNHEAAGRRRDEQKARQSALVIHERQNENIVNYTARIADAEHRIAELDQEIIEAERELLVP